MPRQHSFLQLQVGLWFKFHLCSYEKVKRSHRRCPTCAGQLHVQMKGKSGESAFTSTFRVPLSRWCQISVMMQGATVSGCVLIRRPGSSQVVKPSFSLFGRRRSPCCVWMRRKERFILWNTRKCEKPTNPVRIQDKPAS